MRHFHYSIAGTEFLTWEWPPLDGENFALFALAFWPHTKVLA